MLDERVKFALDNFLTLEQQNKSYRILSSELSYKLLEDSKEVKAELILCVNTDNSVCITNFDKKAAAAIGQLIPSVEQVVEITAPLLNAIP